MGGPLSPEARITVALLLLLGSRSIASAQTMQTIGVHEARLELIGPDHPDFGGLVKSLLGEESDPEFELLRNYSVILSNNTTKTVVGYDIRWEYTDRTGKRLTVDHSDGRIHWLLDASGTKKPGSSELRYLPVLPPNTSTIVMPFVGFRKTADISKRASDPRNLAELKDHVVRFSSGSDLVATLDGAFFDDGAFVGPDKSGYFSIFQAELYAYQNLAAFILKSAQDGRDLGGVAKEIEATYASTPPPMTADRWRVEYQKVLCAQEFLSIFQMGGSQAGLQWAQHNFFQHAPKLTRTGAGGPSDERNPSR